MLSTPASCGGRSTTTRLYHYLPRDLQDSSWSDLNNVFDTIEHGITLGNIKKSMGGKKIFI